MLPMVADLEVGRSRFRRSELACRRRATSALLTLPDALDVLDVRQVGDLLQDHGVVAARRARQAVHRGRDDEVGGIRAPQERGIRRLRAPRAGDRAHREPADESDEQHDREVAAPPAAEGRAEAVPGDPQCLCHAAISVPSRLGPAQEADFPAWECPHPEPRPRPAPWLAGAAVFVACGDRRAGGGCHACRVVGDVAVVDPVGGGHAARTSACSRSGSRTTTTRRPT